MPHPALVGGGEACERLHQAALGLSAQDLGRGPRGPGRGRSAADLGPGVRIPRRAEPEV